VDFCLPFHGERRDVRVGHEIPADPRLSE
jgi:hypothetical protein